MSATGAGWAARVTPVQAGGDPIRWEHMHAFLETIPVDQHASRDGFGGGRSILHVKLPLYVVPWPLKWISRGRGRKVHRVGFAEGLSNDV